MKKLFLIYFIVAIALISLDYQTSAPVNAYDLEQWRYNPAQGSCAPCGAPCK